MFFQLRTSRHGLSLLELLVVVAILAVLCGLVASAVQKSRTAAVRLACANNMKQLGLAAAGFESANKTIPPSIVVSIGSKPGSPGQPGHPYPVVVHSWVPNFLPYLEQQALSDKYRMDYPWFASSPDNLAVLQNPIRTLICPATPGGIDRRVSGTFRHKSLPEFPYKNLAVTDYSTCSSINEPSITFFGYPEGTTQNQTLGAMRPQFGGDGVHLLGITPSRPLKMVEVTDGTSSTILMCESAGRPHYYVGGVIDPSLPLNDGGWGHHQNDYGLDGVFSKTAPITPGECVINCNNNNETYSFHTGGAMHAFCDGSVRFVRESIAPRVYAALVTAQGGRLTEAEAAPNAD